MTFALAAVGVLALAAAPYFWCHADRFAKSEAASVSKGRQQFERDRATYYRFAALVMAAVGVIVLIRAFR